MICDFNSICPDSKLWIFSSKRQLSLHEQAKINNLLSKFLINWESHNKALLSSLKIFNSIFIVIAVDEKKQIATGCSIDSLYNEIKKLHHLLKLDFLDSSILHIKINENIKSISFTEIQNIVDTNTLFFDTTIKKKKELDSWLIPIKDGWCNAFLK